MPRSPRLTVPGLVYHLLNRRVMRLPLFETDGDYLAFEDVLAQGLNRPDAPELLAYCLMPSHWHLAVLAGPATDLSAWVQWVTVTHTHRRHAHRRTAGEGPLYQGRFKSFPVERDGHCLMLCRYVEANPKRAGLVKRAELWRWGSLFVRERGGPERRAMLSDWPVDRPRRWVEEVNRPWEDEPLERLRRSVARGAPLGSESWVAKTAARLGLDATLRPRGRPRKAGKAS